MQRPQWMYFAPRSVPHCARRSISIGSVFGVHVTPLLAATQGTPGGAYCVGGHGGRTNKQLVEAISQALDHLLPAGAPHSHPDQQRTGSARWPDSAALVCRAPAHGGGVGGREGGCIQANNNYPADFLLDNLKTQTHVFETAWRSGVRRLLFLGSSCIFPKFAEQPIREKALCQQHGFDAISLLAKPSAKQLPTNLYWPGDNYHPTNSHVLPALIRRFHEAAEAHAPNVTGWGTDTPLREFIHVEDLGEACVVALEQWQPGPDELQFLNVCMGVGLSIRELAEQVAAATGFQGEINWDATKPDGTPKKQLDVSRLAALGWQARIWISLAERLVSPVAAFREQLSENLVRL